jgi:glycosyltransferase involved in cell wall biosynthesis
MTKKLPRLVIVMPCYNEAEILPSTAAKMEKLLEDMVKAGLTSADSRVCLVDDGSKDQTGEVIKKICGKKKYFTALTLSRNFGQQAAMLAGHPEAVYLDFQTDNYWFHRSFYRAVAYYHPGHKFSVKPYAFEKYDDINLVLDNLRPLEKGDLYLHYNGLNRKPPFFPKEHKYRPVYENPVITVYEVQ